MIIVPTDPGGPARSHEGAVLDELIQELLRLGLRDLDVELRHRRIDGEVREVLVLELPLAGGR